MAAQEEAQAAAVLDLYANHTLNVGQSRSGKGFAVRCIIDHRDLHSFPTRRSSDLAHPRNTRWSPVSPPTTGAAWPPSERRDRKSTRLNSSHVERSYADFCLKKKMAHLAEERHGRAGGSTSGGGPRPLRESHTQCGSVAIWEGLCCSMHHRPPRSTLFPYTTLFRSRPSQEHALVAGEPAHHRRRLAAERTARSEEHTSELQSRREVVCRLLLEKKNGPSRGRATWPRRRKHKRRRSSTSTRITHSMWVSRDLGRALLFDASSTTEIYTLSLHDALPISPIPGTRAGRR